MQCSSCTAELPPAARFCPSCGQPVGAPRSEERRVVTVLFADVVGFTGLAEHRDPEQVKRLIDRCMNRLVGDITAFGGTVDKILGDGVLALFGAPVAHEDDAERAVRAALRMQAAIGGTRGLDGPELSLRIGINTGEVVVGALGTRGDYTAMGDVVNTASRLQALAPPGRVLVGEATRHLTAAAISYESYGEVVARGREQTVTAWLAVAATAPPGGHRHRPELPLVGRDDELGLLLGGMRFAVARNRAFLAAIEGEGGVGKSRIVAEIVERMHCEVDLPVLEGGCVPYGEPNAWWPLASAMVDYLEIDPNAEPERIRSAAAARGGSLVGLEPGDPELTRLQDALLHLLGLPSALDELEPARARQELSRAVIAVLQARTRRGPVLLTITDVHWADPSVTALLEQVMNALADLPFVLITTSRPGSEVAWPPAGGSYSALRLRLEPLDRVAAAELVRGILGHAADEATVNRLYERSGGNPLFLEELTSLVAAHPGRSELPDSLRALVSARLDQLPADERLVLDNAAVLGGSGSISALVHFGTAMGVADTERLAAHLVEAGLLAIESQRWRFRSESVRDVAYLTLTKTARAQRHAGIAREMASGPTTIRAEEIAHHYATAAELVGELGPIRGVSHDVGELAVRWLEQAADWAADQMYPRSAVRLAGRGLDIVEPDGSPSGRAARRRLLLIRADALADLRQLVRARADVASVMASAVADDDRGAEASARRQLGEIERFDGNFPDARASLDAAIALCRELGDEPQLARALRSRGFLEVFGGAPIDAAVFLDEADELYLRLGDRSGHAWVEQNRAWMAFLAGQISAADERLHRAAAVMEDLGDQGGIGWAFGLLAYVRFYAGNREEAAQIAETVKRNAAERGDEWAVGMMQALQANLQLWEGHVGEALRLADEARTRLRKLGDGYGQIQAIAPAVRALVALGRFADARTSLDELAALAPRYGMEGLGALVTLGAAVHAGATERALEAASSAIAIDRTRGGMGTTDVRLGRTLALAMNGEVAEAVISLGDTAIDDHTQPYPQAVAALVALLDGRLDDARAAAAATLDQPGATYLDRTYALVARAGVDHRRGEHERALVALEEAWLTVCSTEDLVACEIVSKARAQLGDSATTEPTFPLPGWQRLVRAAFDPETEQRSGEGAVGRAAPR